MTKLNLGGGATEWHEDGWNNLDINTGYDLTKNHLKEYPDNSVELVYSSHCLEHMEFHQGIALMRAVHRVLVPRGTVRIVVPDIDILGKALLTKDFDWLQRGDPGYYTNALRGEPFVSHMTKLIGWNHFDRPGTETLHSAFYSWSSLASMLKLIGFSRIEMSDFLCSAVPDFSKEAKLRADGPPVSGFDNRGHHFISLYVEARK